MLISNWTISEFYNEDARIHCGAVTHALDDWFPPEPGTVCSDARQKRRAPALHPAGNHNLLLAAIYRLDMYDTPQGRLGTGHVVETTIGRNATLATLRARDLPLAAGNMLPVGNAWLQPFLNNASARIMSPAMFCGRTHD
jgi:hypothetical protein